MDGGEVEEQGWEREVKVRRRAVFLDRDGVINVNPAEGDWVKTWGEFEFLPGALEGLAMLARLPVALVVVTNQSCVGRGIVSLEEVERIHERMVEAIERAGGRIDGVYVCPHAPWEGCACRKPGVGLLLRAAGEMGLDLRRSFLVGDRPGDVIAGRRVGCGTFFVDGRYRCEGADWKVRGLLEAARIIRRLLGGGD